MSQTMKRRRGSSYKAWKDRLVLLLFCIAQLLTFAWPLHVKADTAPTVSDYKISDWTDDTTSETTSTLNWSAGDLIVVLGLAEQGNRTLGTPTATGLTFSLVTSLNDTDGTDVALYVWTATAGSNGSSMISSTAIGDTAHRGLAAYAFSGSAGVGSTGTLDNSINKVVPLTRANSNSAVISVMGDWNADTDTTVTSSPVGGTVRQANLFAGRASFFLADWGDQGGPGSTSYGVADHGGTVDMSGIALEVKGTPAALEQEGYRWRADDGNESGATWLAAQDTNITRGANVNTRLRTLVNATGDPSSEQYQLEWRKVGGPTDWRKVSNAPLTGQVISTVSTGSDDAQQVGTTSTIGGTTIGASLDATTDWVGMRFQNVAIPKGATVTSASVSVVPSGTGEDEPLVTIFAEDADSAATFTTGASNISNRTRTSGIAWSSTDLAATGATYHASSDISAAVQTVVNRASWSTGNPIAIVMQGGANTARDLTIESFENAGNNPPRLTVNFTYPNPAFELAASSNISASGENTTAQLAAPSGKITSDFVAGRMQDDENPADSVDITNSDYTELEWSIKAMSGVVAASEEYEFRVTSNGTVLTAYSATPKWTIGSSNTAPGSPSSAAQYKSDDSTSLATGAWTNETTVVLKATVTDSDGGDTIAICAEVDPIATAFSSPAGDGDGCSVSSVSSGGTASVTISGLSTNTEYHWQIKAKDAAGAYSSWVTYGGNTENPPTNPAARDFGIDTSAPTGGTVYDGTTTGVDKTFSDTSLSTLSANWDGFVFTVSGIQKYEYSIGTTAGATNIKGWTDNGTTTSVTAASLTLQTSQLYFVNVRASDNAGNTVIRSSDGQLVAPSLTFSASPASITFNPLNTGNSYTDSTKETTLTTSTNAYGGYLVRLAAPDLPRSPGNTTISNFLDGSYASPAAWGSSTGFGYSTTDADIFPQSGSCPGGGTAPCFAPYSQTKPGDIVASHTSNVSGSPISDEVVTIKHRVTVAPDQAATTYATILLYTVTALY